MPDEAKTRKELIDPALEKAGWNVKNQNQVGIEIPVDGLDPAADVVYYANFGVKDDGNIYLAWAPQDEYPKENIKTWSGRPIGQQNELLISVFPDEVRFKANDKLLHTIETQSGGFYLNFMSGADKNGYIKSSWDYIGWSYFEEE